MKIRLRYRVWFLRKSWINGITIYPFIFFKQRKEDISDRLFRHELEHIYQVRREGWLKFYIKYLYYQIRLGYRNIPYEVEARAVQFNALTAEERELKDRS
jgi:hypothetical protein